MSAAEAKLYHAGQVRAFRAAGADMVIGGHIHLPYVAPLQGLARPLWAVQAGTAVSSRVRPAVPQSVNLLRWDAGTKPGCCLIERWDHSAPAGRFVRSTVTEVRPARA